MITIEYSGGIGNQLFQYALSRAIELDFNINVYSDFSRYKKTEKRTLQIKKFNSKYSEKSIGFFKRKFISFYLKFFKKDFKWVYKEKTPGQFDKNLILEIQKVKNSLLLLGYWQNHMYFDKHKEILKDELKLKTNIKSPDFNESDVLVHVRRGDYNSVINKKIFSVCDLNYYNRCIKFFRDKNKNCTFYFFSDDINWCKKKFVSRNFKFIENKNDIVEFEMMKKFKNYIISNSTFSWWGAYLSDYKKTTVLCPKTWWNTRPGVNIALQNWIKK